MSSKSPNPMLQQHYQKLRNSQDYSALWLATTLLEQQSPEHTAQRFLQEVGSIIQCPLAFINWLSLEKSTHHWQHTELWFQDTSADYTDLIGQIKQQPLHITPEIESTLLAGSPVIITDLINLLGTQTAQASQAHQFSRISLTPIIRQQRVIGVVGMFCLGQAENLPDILNILTLATTQLGSLLEKQWLQHQVTTLHPPDEHQALNQQRQQLEKNSKLASIGKLAHSVAHEVSNSLNFVDSNIDMMKKYLHQLQILFDAHSRLIQAINDKPSSLSDLKQRVQELHEQQDSEFIIDDMNQILNDALQGLHQIHDMIHNLESVSQDENESREEIDINQCLDSALIVIDNELKHKCQVNKSLGTLPAFYGYPAQINQVFMNLLINAGQAISDFGEIFINTWVEPPHILIEIRDTGCGIPKEHMGELFKAFFTTKPAGVGTGLGLSTSHDIIKQHGGSIDIESTAGQGSTFTIKLPHPDHTSAH